MRARFTLIALAVVGLVLASCGGSSEPFDFATDDLCERISAEQVAGFVEEAYGWEVAVADGEPGGILSGFGEPGDRQRCEWELTDSDGEKGYVAAGLWVDSQGNPIELSDELEGEGPVDFVEMGERTVGIDGPWVMGHPSLGSGVVVRQPGWQAPVYGVPPREQCLQLGIDVPGSCESWTEDNERMCERQYFAAANAFLDALGWLPEA